MVACFCQPFNWSTATSHLPRICHCHCHRAYSPISNTASHDNHEKINSWVSFTFQGGHRALLGSPLGSQSIPTLTHDLLSLVQSHKAFT